MPVVLGYWNIRGLAEPIRYLLHYLQVDFEDKRYEFGPEPNYLDCEWTKTDKFNLGLELPNIPYYIDGDLKLTQSLVIMRYLARKNNLYLPKSTDNDPQLLRFETMEGHLRDFTMTVAFMAYNPNYEQFREIFSSSFKDKVKATADFMGNNVWVFGEEISHLDFLLFEALDVLKMCFNGILDDHPSLVQFMDRFASLPGIEQYRKKSLKWPIFSPYAFWGGKGEAPE